MKEREKRNDPRACELADNEKYLNYIMARGKKNKWIPLNAHLTGKYQQVQWYQMLETFWSKTNSFTYYHAVIHWPNCLENDLTLLSDADSLLTQPFHF